MFPDRIRAGLLLATQLSEYDEKPAVILAVPRGGVPVGFAIARELGLPMEIVLSKKIGHPNNPEYAIGAASLTDYFIDRGVKVSQEYIEEEVARVRSRLREMSRLFIGKREPENLSGKIVIIVDDGIATGRTILETVETVRRRRPEKIIVAAPVSSVSAVRLIEKEADQVVVLSTPANFYGVGQFYTDFEEVSDADVVRYLERLRSPAQGGHPG